jgi:hypothetical protein
VGGLPVLVGVDSPRQGSQIGGLWAAIAATLAQTPTMDVVADCGRLLPGLPSEHVITAADLLVLVVRPTAESVAHARHALDTLATADASRPHRLHVAVVGEAATLGRDVEQIRDALSGVIPDVAEFGGLAHDAQAAAGLAGTPTRKLDRSALVTSARHLAHELYERVHRDRTETNGPAVNVDAPRLDAAPVEVG